jgi:dipeptidyl-peptidase III
MQHLIKSGIARLEEVRDATGKLKNLYVSVGTQRGSIDWVTTKSKACWRWYVVQVDREQVLKHGQEASGKLLIELQVRKSTADGAGAREFYTSLTKPLEGWDGEIRDLVLKKKLVGFLFRVIQRTLSEKKS